jgi:hypothetical protein
MQETSIATKNVVVINLVILDEAALPSAGSGR